MSGDMLRDLARVQEQAGRLATREKAMTLLPLNPHDGLISPFAANGNPFLAPIWRDCSPARLAMSVYCAANDGANFWTITLYISGAFGLAQGSVDTSALAAAQWQPLSLTAFAATRWSAASFPIAYIQIAKTGAPGNLYLSPALYVL